MSNEVVDLLSDSEDDIQLCEQPSSITPTSPPKSEDEFPDVDFGECVAPQEEIDFSLATFTQVNAPSVASDEFSISTFTLTNPPSSKSRSKNVASSVHKSPIKKAAKSKEDRILEKAQKEKSKAYEKALKSAQAANKKCAKAADCLKFVTAVMDARLLDYIPNSGNILTHLQESGIKHSINMSSTPNSVFWKRETLHHLVNDNCEVESHSNTTEEDEGIVVLTAKDFSTVAQPSIKDFILQTLRSLNKTRLTLVVFGLNEYSRLQKTKNKQQFRQRVSKENGKRPNWSADDSELGLTPSQIEELKVNVLLETQSSIWPVETSEELGKTIARITKAVAERPFKQERFEQQFDFYAADVSGNVRVSKDGQGLTRLWQEQIQQFSLAALETSQAIVSKYPTPLSLVQAYKSLNDEREASLLLQDIPVRRHAGPLSTSRRVGPELSKKIYKYLTSKDGRDILC